MTVNEAWATAQELLRSMSMEERTAYAFCFQTSRSHQFFFALLRQPSFFNAEGLEKLLEEWTNIENSSEYKETIEERKKTDGAPNPAEGRVAEPTHGARERAHFRWPIAEESGSRIPRTALREARSRNASRCTVLEPRLHRVPPARRGPHVGICAVRRGTAFLLRQGRGVP